MDSDIKNLKEKLREYERLEQEWTQERELYKKNMTLLQQELNKYKAMNANLLKKNKHKRTSSEEQTFIFNQTNISSYYPIMVMKGSGWAVKNVLRSHLDSVRGICWFGKYLVSGGEDCLLKIWERDKLLMTVREHLAPIYTLHGHQNMLVTAGAEGVVRKWEIDNFRNNEGPSAEAEVHDDCIWEILWNHGLQALLTSSADGCCKLLKVQEKAIMPVGVYKVSPDIPTSITYYNDKSFVMGLVSSAKLLHLDLETGKKLTQFLYQPREAISQSNKIIHHHEQKLLISGHEDRTIRFYDPASSNKPIKTIVAHSDSITSVLARPFDKNELLSCSHDGTVRIWDLRQYRCLHDVPVHMKKYDESAMCITHSEEEHTIAVGGADGNIKLLHPEN